MKNITEKLVRVQSELKAPKTQKNTFANYNYRSAEDILEAVKPLLHKEGLIITITDEMVALGDRFYVKATATITDGEESIATTGWAREALDKKGMDESQVTGMASSYARKYAMNGLLAINDEKDADSFDNRKADKKPETKVETKSESNGDILTGFCSSKKQEEDVDKDQLVKFYKYYQPKMNTWKNTVNPEILWTKWMATAR